jgi:hypothetical protein
MFIYVCMCVHKYLYIDMHFRGGWDQGVYVCLCFMYYMCLYIYVGMYVFVYLYMDMIYQNK